MRIALTIVLLIAGLCASTQTLLSEIDFYSIDEMQWSAFADERYEQYYDQERNVNTFRQEFFRPWGAKRDAEAIIKKWCAMPENLPCYHHTLRAYDDEDLRLLSDRLARVSTVGRNALITDNSSLRSMPSDAKCLKRIHRAGELFPFDYFQESGLWLATPIHVIAETDDGLWLLVDSHCGVGWIPSRDAAYLEDLQEDLVLRAELSICTEDDLITRTERGVYELHIGTILPSHQGQVMLPYRNGSGFLSFDPVTLDQDIESFPLSFTEKNVKMILSRLHGELYGWGGNAGGRDCSSTLKDYFACFGIWIPRNSYAQAQSARVIELAGDQEAKHQQITEEAIPFLSTIYKKGHIVLYGGKSDQGIALAFHNTWALKVWHKDKSLLKVSKRSAELGTFGFHADGDKPGWVQSRIPIGAAVITRIDPGEAFSRKRKIQAEDFLDRYLYLTHHGIR